MTVATASTAPLWIAGWIVVLAVLVGAVVYAGRRQKSRQRRQS